jgi:glycerophosphoryl diester phosphodiesterase
MHAFLDFPAPIPFAHRGGASEAPENTLPAFRYAVDLGYRYLETDVQATSDGVIVAFHDDDLSRATDRSGHISSLPLAEVRTALVDGREPIPLLDELLEEFPQHRFNIDCKSDQAVAGLVAAVRRHHCLERICVGGFSDARIAALQRELGPSLCTSFGPRGIARLRAASVVPRIGSRLAPRSSQAAQIPVRQMGIQLVDQRFVSTAHRANLKVHVWTIDDADEMEHLLELGVDGIMTDRPAVLKEVLQRRGAWVA